MTLNDLAGHLQQPWVIDHQEHSTEQSRQLLTLLLCQRRKDALLFGALLTPRRAPHATPGGSELNNHFAPVVGRSLPTNEAAPFQCVEPAGDCGRRHVQPGCDLSGRCSVVWATSTEHVQRVVLVVLELMRRDRRVLLVLE